MKRATRLQTAAVVILVALLTSCAPQTSGPTAPTVPTPPQIQVANAVNALAQALDAAITGLQAARNNGKIPAADVAAAEKVAAIIATTGKQVDAELRSVDDWPTQKTKILAIVTTSGLRGATANLNQNAAALLAASVALYDQIAAAVGGPQI